MSDPGSKITVMIVDDQPAILKEISALVDKSGFAQVIASETDGETAIESALRLRPDIILLDVSIPVISGIEIARIIKESWDTVAIIAISAHDNDVYIRSMLKAGASGYILKDHVSNEIKLAIPAVMNGERWIGRGLNQHSDI